MATLQIALFKSAHGGADQAIQDAQESTNESDDRTVTGLQVQDPSIIQVTSESDGGNSQLQHNLRTICGEPTQTYRVKLNASAFGAEGAAASPFVEYVANFFPASRVTPDFQAQVEREFLSFDSICKTVAEGDGGLAYGWSPDELEHEDVKDEKVKPFVILRGWRSMQDFENLTKTETFQKDAIPVLLGWKAPFKMVSRVSVAEVPGLGC